MDEDKRYNGWANYETWNVKLWMDNDQGLQEYWAERAQEVYDSAKAERIFTREENAAGELSKVLKDYYEEEMADMLEESNTSASMWADLLGAALSEVDWMEIAENLLSDVTKEA